MKRYSVAYRPEESDGPVTVGNIAKLAARYRRDEYHRHSTDDPPLLVLSHGQWADLMSDPGLIGYNYWAKQVRTIYGFHVVEAEEG